MARNGQPQANQRKRLGHCNAGEIALSISGKLQTMDSIEYFNAVKHAMALSNSTVADANSSTTAVRTATR